jgi:hypothetical protein
MMAKEDEKKHDMCTFLSDFSFLQSEIVSNEKEFQLKLSILLKQVLFISQ